MKLSQEEVFAFWMAFFNASRRFKSYLLAAQGFLIQQTFALLAAATKFFTSGFHHGCSPPYETIWRRHEFEEGFSAFHNKRDENLVSPLRTSGP